MPKKNKKKLILGIIALLLMILLICSWLLAPQVIQGIVDKAFVMVGQEAPFGTINGNGNGGNGNGNGNGDNGNGGNGNGGNGDNGNGDNGNGDGEWINLEMSSSPPIIDRGEAFNIQVTSTYPNTNMKMEWRYKSWAGAVGQYHEILRFTTNGEGRYTRTWYTNYRAGMFNAKVLLIDDSVESNVEDIRVNGISLSIELPEYVSLTREWTYDQEDTVKLHVQGTYNDWVVMMWFKRQGTGVWLYDGHRKTDGLGLWTQSYSAMGIAPGVYYIMATLNMNADFSAGQSMYDYLSFEEICAMGQTPDPNEEAWKWYNGGFVLTSNIVTKIVNP